MAHLGDISITVDTGQFEDAMHDIHAAMCLQDAQDVLQQFIEDGGEPWAIYRAEVAMFGMTLEQMAAGSHWQMS